MLIGNVEVRTKGESAVVVMNRDEWCARPSFQHDKGRIRLSVAIKQ